MPRRNHPKKRKRGTWENGFEPRQPKGSKRGRGAFRLGAERDEHFFEAERRLREAEEAAA